MPQVVAKEPTYGSLLDGELTYNKYFLLLVFDVLLFCGKPSPSQLETRVIQLENILASNSAKNSFFHII
jgi:hypothetical protein